jgi:transcription elongation factor GreA
VGAAEAQPTNGLISNESPVGRALLGKRVGDEVQISVPKGVFRLTITRIS